MGVVMQVRNAVLLFSIFSVLAGCGMFGNRQVDYKAGAVAVQPLEVPPDLVTPVVSSRAVLPAADGTQVANYSDFARTPKVAETPCVSPAPAVVQAVAQPAAAKLLQVGAARFILLSEPFERAWRTVGLALDRAGIKPSDVDRSKGLYFLKISGRDKTSTEARLLVSESAGISVVTVEGMAQQDAAARLLESVHQHMAQ